MKIQIEGTPKEIADLTKEVQSQPEQKSSIARLVKEAEHYKEIRR